MFCSTRSQLRQTRDFQQERSGQILLVAVLALREALRRVQRRKAYELA